MPRYTTLISITICICVHAMGTRNHSTVQSYTDVDNGYFPIDIHTIRKPVHEIHNRLRTYLNRRAQQRTCPETLKAHIATLSIYLSPTDFVTFHHNAEALLTRIEQKVRLERGLHPCTTEEERGIYDAMTDPSNANSILLWQAHIDALHRNPYQQFTYTFLHDVSDSQEPVMQYMHENNHDIWYTHLYRMYCNPQHR